MVIKKTSAATKHIKRVNNVIKKTTNVVKKQYKTISTILISDNSGEHSVYAVANFDVIKNRYTD